jgi:hypothetical protein
MGHCHGGQEEGEGQHQHCHGGQDPEEREERVIDHLEYTTRLWEKAFFEALHEVRVDLMKEKIKAAWGENMGQTASSVLEAFQGEWKKFQEEEAKKEKEAGPVAAIKDKIKEGLKKGPQ